MVMLLLAICSNLQARGELPVFSCRARIGNGIATVLATYVKICMNVLISFILAFHLLELREVFKTR